MPVYNDKLKQLIAVYPILEMRQHPNEYNYLFIGREKEEILRNLEMDVHRPLHEQISTFLGHNNFVVGVGADYNVASYVDSAEPKMYRQKYVLDIHVLFGRNMDEPKSKYEFEIMARYSDDNNEPTVIEEFYKRASDNDALSHIKELARTILLNDS